MSRAPLRGTAGKSLFITVRSKSPSIYNQDVTAMSPFAMILMLRFPSFRLKRRNDGHALTPFAFKLQIARAYRNNQLVYIG